MLELATSPRRRPQRVHVAAAPNGRDHHIAWKVADGWVLAVQPLDEFATKGTVSPEFELPPIMRAPIVVDSRPRV